MVKVGVVGAGKMGSAFALNLLSRQNEVHMYNRSKEKLRPLVEKGAIAHPSPYELGKAVDVVVTSLPDQDVIDKVAGGSDGLLMGLKKGSLWLEMSTIDPDASRRQAEEAVHLGIDRLDSPVIGSPGMAAKGQISLLVGGDSQVFQKYRTLLDQLGSSVIYLGKAGQGHVMKLVLNTYLAMLGVSFSEAFILSRKLGMDTTTFIDAFNKTAHKNYYSDTRGPGIIKGDYAPPSFTANMLLKDLTLANRQIVKYKAVLGTADVAKQLFTSCVDQGYGEMDISAVAKVIEELNGFKPS